MVTCSSFLIFSGFALEKVGSSFSYVSIRQHTSAYVSIRQHLSAYVSIRHLQQLLDFFWVRAREGGVKLQLPRIALVFVSVFVLFY